MHLFASKENFGRNFFSTIRTYEPHVFFINKNNKALVSKVIENFGKDKKDIVDFPTFILERVFTCVLMLI